MANIIQAVTIRWYNACADYAIELSRGLRDLGHRVTLSGGVETPAIKKASAYGLNVIDLMEMDADSGNGFFSVTSKYRNYALSNKVQLVNVHSGRDHFLWSYALRGTGIPLIRTSGNQLPPNTNFFSQFLNKKKTAGFIASCKKIRGFYSEAFDIKPEDIAVINGGVDNNYYSKQHEKGKLREMMGIPRSSFVFGLLARFSPDKGHNDFFKAAGILAVNNPNVWFVVAGKNAQLKDKDIRDMALKAGISDRTRFPGFLTDVRDVINSVDVGVVASTASETICRIAMEYMAMGIPVLGTDTNVIPEVVRDGINGYSVPANNPEAMAVAMEKMLNNKDKMIEMSKNACEIVESEYSLKSFANKTLDAYRKITGYEL